MALDRSGTELTISKRLILKCEKYCRALRQCLQTTLHAINSNSASGDESCAIEQRAKRRSKMRGQPIPVSYPGHIAHLARKPTPLIRLAHGHATIDRLEQWDGYFYLARFLSTAAARPARVFSVLSQPMQASVMLCLQCTRHTNNCQLYMFSCCPRFASSARTRSCASKSAVASSTCNERYLALTWRRAVNSYNAHARATCTSLQNFCVRFCVRTGCAYTHEVGAVSDLLRALDEVGLDHHSDDGRALARRLKLHSKAEARIEPLEVVLTSKVVKAVLFERPYELRVRAEGDRGVMWQLNHA
eukprot:6191273-Pleurochrysis_carterae.AAC.1